MGLGFIVGVGVWVEFIVGGVGVGVGGGGVIRFFGSKRIETGSVRGDLSMMVSPY